MGRATFACGLAAVLGCSGPPAPPPEAPPTPTAPQPVASLVPIEDAGAPDAAPEIAAPTPEPARFPPPGFSAPFARTAKPGDGVWAPLVEGAPGAPPILVRSDVHPHPIKQFLHVAIVAVDLRRVELRLVAGTDEPKASVPKERRPGLVPVDERGDLVAVLNGGFMSRHGGYGMMVNGDVFAPPREDSCTVVLSKDGSIRIRTWTVFAGTEPTMASYRQTPPCLLEQGVVHPALETAEKPRRWGSSETGKVEVRRSALGLDETGKTLFYGLGEDITPKELADAMKIAGAVDSAQLDINWSYTRFLLYKQGAPGDPPEVSATLIPKIKHAPGEYVAKPARRDFFYLKRKR